jgi:hypothetical protein
MTKKSIKENISLTADSFWNAITSQAYSKCDKMIQAGFKPDLYREELCTRLSELISEDKLNYQHAANTNPMTDTSIREMFDSLEKDHVSMCKAFMKYGIKLANKQEMLESANFGSVTFSKLVSTIEEWSRIK